MPLAEAEALMLALTDCLQFLSAYGVHGAAITQAYEALAIYRTYHTAPAPPKEQP